MGFFDKLKQGLTKTRDADFPEKVNNVFATFVKVDEELFEELEEALITADVGMETSMYIIETLLRPRQKGAYRGCGRRKGQIAGDNC